MDKKNWDIAVLRKYNEGATNEGKEYYSLKLREMSKEEMWETVCDFCKSYNGSIISVEIELVK